MNNMSNISDSIDIMVSETFGYLKFFRALTRGEDLYHISQLFLISLSVELSSFLIVKDSDETKER